MRDAFPSEGGLRFDAYHVDLSTGELRKHGRKIRLAGRPFQILALLLEQPGQLLTRKELQARLWSADTFVDFEHGVNAAIQTLRRASASRCWRRCRQKHKRPVSIACADGALIRLGQLDYEIGSRSVKAWLALVPR